MTAERRSFADREALAEALAADVAAALREGIAGRGIGAVVVSGGSTPARFFAALSLRNDVAWENVVITLVDERWVDETSDRSNARLVKETLLRGRAGAALFVPLYSGGPAPDARALERTALAVATVPRPFDAVILGMGSDGHTASFFPGGDNLALALEGDQPVIAMQAPGAGEPRVTLSLAHLLETRALYLHIEGEEKAAVLERALADGPVEDMPVRAVLRQHRVPPVVYWSP